MNRSAIEAVLGLVVLLIAGLFLVTGWQAGNAKAPQSGTMLNASFRSIHGLTVGSEVRLGGVKVGTVDKIALDKVSFQANIQIILREDLEIPVDSELKILNDGLLGGKFLDLMPGKSAEYLSDNQTIAKTHDVVSLEDLLGRAIFLVGNQASN